MNGYIVVKDGSGAPDGGEPFSSTIVRAKSLVTLHLAHGQKAIAGDHLATLNDAGSAILRGGV
jgi:hypothetical protein